MKIRPALPAAALAAFLLTLFSVQANAMNGCQQSAKNMHSSCFAEGREELFEDRANCAHMSNADQHACREASLEASADHMDECTDQFEARQETCDLLGENRYADPLVDEDINFIDPDQIPGSYPNNPYVILQAGHTHVLRGEDELIVVHASNDTREIQGVLCRVVVDIGVEESFDSDEGEWQYDVFEATDDWIAQDDWNNTYYCGEVSRDYEDGVLRDLGGSFEAGREYAKGGALTLAMPAEEQVHRQEYALGEAEDLVQYLAIGTSPTAEEGGENLAFPCAGTCLKTLDFSPIDSESTEYKYYLPGVGFVLSVNLDDGDLTGEREELVCEGDSLLILADPSCGIEDPVELLEELCELHEAFCDD